MWSSHPQLPFFPPSAWTPPPASSSCWLIAARCVCSGVGGIQARRTTGAAAAWPSQGSMKFACHFFHIQSMSFFGLCLTGHGLSPATSAPKGGSEASICSSQLCGGGDRGEGHWERLSDWLRLQVNKQPQLTDSI